MTTAAVEAQWHDVFPKPQAVPGSVSREELKDMIEKNAKEPTNSNKDFLVIDVRRNDHTGGSIKGSVNLPAQSIFYSLSVFYDLCQSAGIHKAIFYCGSSGGRGTRCAAWFQDENQRRGTDGPQGLILAGGIKGWVAAGKSYTDLMDGFNPDP